jgi:hypothetical protein
MKMIREPVVAGQFYPGDREELAVMIDELLGSADDVKKGAPGVIAPHAGYVFSGRCAGHSFSALKKGDTFMILGFSHSGIGRDRLSLSANEWQTPIGLCNNDSELASSLVESGIAVIDERPHMHEHSIEVQVPFLQVLHKDPVILPVSVPHFIDFKATGRKIAGAVKASGRNISIIASSDFTHYGPNYGYVPFSNDIRENLRKLDMGAVEKIRNMDSDGFLKYIDRTGATICGSAPIALLIEVMKSLGNADAEFLDYVTSGDITGDHNNSVSYVSLAFR